MRYDYIKDGIKIYQKSFSIIREEADLSRFPTDFETVAVRMIHACGRIDITSLIDFSENAVAIGRNALQKGKAILCDSEMVAKGITQKRLPAHNEVLCFLSHKETIEKAKILKTTRSAAAVELWREHLEKSVVVIGNAPTALFHLLEMINESDLKPALIIGMPVGFVGAKESKKALSENPYNIPFITIHGRQGGSAMAVAALNALAKEQEI